MSYCLVTTRRTLDNPQGELRFLAEINNESVTTDWRDARRFEDRERVNAAHWQLRNPANWDVLPWPPTADPERSRGAVP